MKRDQPGEKYEKMKKVWHENHNMKKRNCNMKIVHGKNTNYGKHGRETGHHEKRA